MLNNGCRNLRCILFIFFVFTLYFIVRFADSVTLFQNFLAYRASIDQLCRLIHSLDESLHDREKPEVLPLTQTTDILTQPTTLALLRQSNDYVVHFNSWRPSRYIDEYNLKMIAKQSRVLLSFDSDAVVSGVTFTNTTPVLAPKSDRVDIFYYGSADVHQWAAHVLVEARHILDRHAQDKLQTIRLVLHFPLTLSTQWVEDLLASSLGRRSTDPPYVRTTAVVTEFLDVHNIKPNKL